MPTPTIFRPKLFTTLRGYTLAQLGRDCSAGVTVGLIAIPLAIAFGIASIPESVAAEAGLSPPAIGLFTAVVAGLLVSILGGTRISIGGPTGAFVVIVYAVAAKHGYDGLVLATILAGFILILLGLLRLGGLIRFIPYPVTTGFTSGIAVIIAASQLKDFLGLDMPTPPASFIPKLGAIGEHLSTINPASCAIGAGAAATLVILPKITRRIPAPIVAIVGATLVAKLLHLPVESIGDRYGAIPTGLPMPRLPEFSFEMVPELVQPAITIAVLAAIESLLCAVVADGMIGSRHRPNTELIAQGVANIAAPLCGGMPATSAIARTAANAQSGGRSPIAGVVHALTVLVVILALGRYASEIPLAALAGVLMIVAWRMSELHRFAWLLRGPRQDAAVLLVTFALTVLADLTVAVQVGMLLAALLFIKRMADVSGVAPARAMADSASDPDLDAQPRPPSDVEVYRLDGPFFFGAAWKLRDALDLVRRAPRVLILDLESVPAIDATGLHALAEIHRSSTASGAAVLFAGVHAQPLDAMVRSGLLDRFGESSFHPDLPAALRAANR